MKNKKKLILVIICVIILSINTLSFADVGSFDRYDSGDSWSSSPSSWDSSDWSSSYSSDSSSDGEFIGFIIGWLIGTHPGRGLLIIIIIAIVIYRARSKKQGDLPRYNPINHNNSISSSYNTTSGVEVSESHIPTQKIHQFDPNFSEEKMLTWAKDLYIKLQNAWTARDWEPMRPFESEDLFEQHNAQIQNYIDTNRINVVDRIAVNYARMYRFRQEGDRDILEIALKATKKDYIIDATTKEVLEGNKNQDRITVYKMTFERKKGILTPEGTDEIKTTNCPNCGAPTKITSAGKCEYCGSVITIGNNTWVLTGLEPLRN